MSEPLPYNLFVSYAHLDNEGECAGWITSFIKELDAEFRDMMSMSLRAFFDLDGIKSMDDWEHRILKGLRQSKVMLAILSPCYFQSEYCQREWSQYRDHEHALNLLGEGIAPVVIAPHPEFQVYDVESSENEWFQNLKRGSPRDWNDRKCAKVRRRMCRRISLSSDEMRSCVNCSPLC